MKPVLIEEAAEAELVGSVTFYEQRRAGLGLEFEAAAHEAVKSIQQSPETRPVSKSGTRSSPPAGA